MKFLFLLIALFAIVCSSAFEDNYGCDTTYKNKCCWVKLYSCCRPLGEKRTCKEEKTVCCKSWELNEETGLYHYKYTGGTDTL